MTAAPLLPEIQIEELVPAERVRAFFARDRLLAAYALADLDAAEIEKARWWIAGRGDETTAAGGPATYALEVALPPLAVVGGKPGETTVKNLTTHPVAARLDLEVEGMARDTAVVGSGTSRD